MTDEIPKTLMDAVVYYRDPKICFDTMLKVKWPDGKITCPKCGGTTIGVIATRSMLQCNSAVGDKKCGKQFSVKVGTIFEDSPLPLWQWLVAIWCIANAKNGISSLELSRALPNRKGTGNITQTTAWFMLHRIRLAMKTPTFCKLNGVVESDETFIGGRSANMHAKRRAKMIRGRGGIGKTIVQGLMQRTMGDDSPSQIKAFIVRDTSEESLLPNIYQHVSEGCHVFTDAAPSYVMLASRYIHDYVDHLTKYVKGRVHTNGLENFWSLLKRTLKGTYVAVASFHLERYLDEQAFRFNERDTNDAGRFWRVLKNVVGKRLTYRELTSQGDAGFMGIR